MVEIEDLKTQFPVKSCPPWGECIIVPGSEFRKTWEGELYDKGFTCVRTDFGDPSRPAVLVRLDPEGSETRTGIEKIEKKYYLRGRWSEKDQELLLRVMGEECTLPKGSSIEEKAKVALKQFPGRSLHSLLRQYSMLLTPAGLQKALVNVCSKCGLPKDLCTCVEEEKETLRQEPREEKHESAKPEKPSKKRKSKVVVQEPQKAPDDSVKPKLDCNVSIHVEAKSAASIRAVIALLKELRGTK